jgi:hypothetical protein
MLIEYKYGFAVLPAAKTGVIMADWTLAIIVKGLELN